MVAVPVVDAVNASTVVVEVGAAAAIGEALTSRDVPVVVEIVVEVGVVVVVVVAVVVVIRLQLLLSLSSSYPWLQ